MMYMRVEFFVTSQGDILVVNCNYSSIDNTDITLVGCNNN